MLSILIEINVCASPYDYKYRSELKLYDFRKQCITHEVVFVRIRLI